MLILFFFFFFNDTATTEIYTLSLHDALPIFREHHGDRVAGLDQPPTDDEVRLGAAGGDQDLLRREDRKSTRLNSSHGYISYAVFCLKKKKLLDYANRNASTRHVVDLLYPYST